MSAAVVIATTAPLAHAASITDASTVWECDRTKWNWYCDEEIPAPEPDNERSKKPGPPKERKHISELESLEDVKKEREQLQWIATKEPTAENVYRVLDATKWMSDRSSLYADVAQRLVWTNPELDYSTKSPTSAYAIGVKRDVDTQKKQLSMADIAKEHGLFFFFRSDCQYCHAMSPLIKMFESRYGMEVVPISMDGGPLPNFPNPRKNTNAAVELGVTTVPALYLVSKKGVIQPISFGAISHDEVVERIYTLIKTKPGDRY